jgi:superfamily II DNA or RNA helicase
LDNWKYSIDFKDERRVNSLTTTRITKDWFINKGIKLELRFYQVEAVNKALHSTSGFIEAATGSGKTLMVSALCDVLNDDGKRCIVIVPSSDLVQQTVQIFKNCLVDVGVYSGSEKDLHHDTVVATWQSLQNNPVVMHDFDGVIVDECHGIKASVVSALINIHGKDCGYRFGFTGTMPKVKIDQYVLKGSIGEVLHKISAASLMGLGYLSDLEIEPIQITDQSIAEEFPDYASEKAFIIKSPKRLDLIADIIINKAETFGNTLVLVNSIKQGKELQKLIKDSVFLQGETDNNTRAEWYSLFEEKNNLIVIATSGIASTGISIDRVFCLIMIDTGKSFVKCIQSIGRSLRKGHDKNKAHCVDVYSNLKWARKHFAERKKYYKEAEYEVTKVVKYNV